MDLKHACERCHAALSDDGAAYFCAQETTFCPGCYRRLRFSCPNCSGELVRRPRAGPLVPPPPRPPSAAEGSLRVRPATLADLDTVAPLFDAYRQFYEQAPDLAASRRFLEDRLSRGESRIWLAEEGGAALGFVQLYPLFSSVSLGPIYVLNDLFVSRKVRGRGVASRLLETARDYGRATGAHYLELSTAVDNLARRLYESHDWKLDREFLHYDLSLREP